MQDSTTVKISDSTSNPAPLGLAGFGLTTILLNIHNTGLTPLDSMIMSMGIFYGGIAQVIVGYMEWKKNNTFGTMAFTSYGMFWLTLISIWVMPKLGLADAPTKPAMGGFLTVWGVATLFLFIATFKMNRAIQVVFALALLLFALLATANFTGSHLIHTIAGWEGILCGASALYTGMAQVLNEYYGKIVMPLGQPKVAAVTSTTPIDHTTKKFDKKEVELSHN